MRDILFKAKNVESGGWIEGSLVITKEEYSNEIYYAIFEKESEHVCMGEYKDNGHYQIDPNTICQFTGLKDMNGNKIWEHDIVTIKADDEYFHLEWEEDTARFVMNGDGFTVDFDNYWSYEVAIVGNIFDNSDLLGE